MAQDLHDVPARDLNARDGSFGWAAPYGVLVALVVVAAWVGRRLWFFSDDWNIFAGYYRGNLLEPFNGHLSLLPAGIYQFLFNTVGVGSYLPYRVVGLAALVVLGFQVIRFGRARSGTVVTVLAVTAVLWNSFGTTNVMFPFLMNFSLPIAALVAIWWHLDRVEASRRSGPDADAPRPAPTRNLVGVALWMTLALAASGLGVVAAMAIALELLVRRSPWRVWAAWAAPVALWVLWWSTHREANEISTDAGQVVPYLLRMLWAGPTSIAAGNRWLGLALGALFVAALVGVVVRERRIDPRVAGALGAAVAFAALTSLTRQDTFPPIPPDELRYGWTIGAYLVLAALALAPSLSSASDARGSSTPRARIGVAAAVIAVAVLLWGGYRLVLDMSDWTDVVADAAPGLRTNLYAAEAVGSQRMDPAQSIGPLSFVPVRASDYLDAVEAVGSPLQGATETEIGGRADQRDDAAALLLANVDFEAPEPVSSEASSVPVLSPCENSAEDVSVEPGSDVRLQVDVLGSSAATGARGIVGETPTVTLYRFGSELVTFELLAATSQLTLPQDAPIGTQVDEPYRLVATGSSICSQEG